MGQHMTHSGSYRTTNPGGCQSTIDKYTAANCEGCPLRCRCFDATRGNRTIHVNHRLNRYKRKARELLLSDEGMRHRSRRPIEPEAVFGQIKFDMQYRRFRHRGLDKVRMDFALLAMSFNLRKLFKNAARTIIASPNPENMPQNVPYLPLIRQSLTPKLEKTTCTMFAVLRHKQDRGCVTSQINRLLTHPRLNMRNQEPQNNRLHKVKKQPDAKEWVYHKRVINSS